MIVTRLIGGLGNQLFQYAAAKALALRHDTIVKVDTTALNINSNGIYTQRNFELLAFKSTIEIATESDLKKIQRFQRLPLVIKNIFNSYYIANEQGSQYQTAFDNFPNNTYLNGFWQSELYFKKYEPEIKNDFIFNDIVINENQLMANQIIATESISLHIRRGDYVSNKVANQYHGLCDINYYEQALKLISETKQNLQLYIFSDDITWCKENLKFDFPVFFIETNNAHSDLHLMSLCKHHIIANSSFSWWGAWLNNNKNKIVVAPKKWYANSEVNTSNIIPTSWHQL